jgi:hypothetical protein
MLRFFLSVFLFFFVTLGLFNVGHTFSFAEGVKLSVDVRSLLQKATISLSPRSGTFLEGSTFEVPVFIDTQGKSINTIELHMRFDPKKLSILQPAGTRSIIGVWVEPPSYSNADGSLKLVGVIPGGVNTKSGLITTITFKALIPGDTRVRVIETTQVLANDGLGTSVDINFDSVAYSIVPKAPDGVRVFSDTHSFQDRWYNNMNPVLSWEKPEGVTGFSYELDDKPATVPDAVKDTEDTVFSPSEIREGLSYFHIRAEKKGVWGSASHFLLRIDQTPPAEFKPTIDTYTAAIITSRALVSFFTTDALSGVDHYEVAVIDKKDSANISPVFVQTQSPYQLPTQSSGDIRVIVRAVDGAGNVRDESIDVNLVPSWSKLLKDNMVAVVLGLALLIILILLLIHYLFGHNILKIIFRAFKIASEGSKTPIVPETNREIVKPVNHHQFLLDQLEKPAVEIPQNEISLSESLDKKD